MKRCAALGLALATLSFAGVASAAPPATPPRLTPGADVYSGYAAVASSFTSVTAQWKQPAVTCPPAGAGIVGGVTNLGATGSAMARIPGLTVSETLPTLFIPHVGVWVGLIGMNGPTDRTLIQTGTGTLCRDGVAHPTGFFETPSFADQAGLPDPDPGTPGTTWDSPSTEAGDDIAATVTWDGRGTYQLTVADTTRSWRFGATYRSPVVPTAALAVVESIPYNEPSFAPVTFTEVTADGKPFGAYDVHAFTIDGSRSAPTPLTGTSFTVPAS